MLRKSANPIVVFVFVNFMFSCRNSSHEILIKNQLSDSLFALKNIGLADIDKIKFIDNGLYQDSTKRVAFVPLDSFYVEKILAPILKEEEGVNQEYVKSFMYYYFISIQDKISEYQPLVIWSSGDDYESMILAIVDSSFNPISHLVLSGGLLAGPYEINDSLSSWGEHKYSIIKDKVIETYMINTYVLTNSGEDTAYVDSITYRSEILENGNIKRLSKI